MRRVWRVGAGFPGWSSAPCFPKRPLWLGALGPLTLGGVFLRGRRRQALFAALLEARASRREGLAAWELLDLLYPGQDEERAFGALRELVFVLRQQFGYAVLERRGPLYTLGCQVVSDLELFLKSPRVWLWRGRYLDGLATDEALWSRVYQLARDAARSCLSKEPEECFRLASLLAAEEPYDPALLVLMLESLSALAEDGLLRKVYGHARDRFSEVGLTLPQDPAGFLKAWGL